MEDEITALVEELKKEDVNNILDAAKKLKININVFVKTLMKYLNDERTTWCDYEGAALVLGTIGIALQKRNELPEIVEEIVDALIKRLKNTSTLSFVCKDIIELLTEIGALTKDQKVSYKIIEAFSTPVEHRENPFVEAKRVNGLSMPVEHRENPFVEARRVNGLRRIGTSTTDLEVAKKTIEALEKHLELKRMDIRRIIDSITAVQVPAPCDKKKFNCLFGSQKNRETRTALQSQVKKRN